MTTYNLGMPGNTHVDKLVAVGNIPVETANYYATMALAFETRTANLLAVATAFPEMADDSLKDMVKGRLGL